jgi:hypothetical protein
VRTAYRGIRLTREHRKGDKANDSATLNTPADSTTSTDKPITPKNNTDGLASTSDNKNGKGTTLVNPANAITSSD